MCALQVKLRGCSHDTGMTFILERVHSIPIYFSVSVYMIPKRNFIPTQVIPCFNPNEILVLVWHLILMSCKLKANSVMRWKRKPCSLGWVAHGHHFQDGRQNGHFQDGWDGEWSTNFILEQNFGMKLNLVSGIWYHVNSPLDSGWRALLQVSHCI